MNFLVFLREIRYSEAEGLHLFSLRFEDSRELGFITGAGLSWREKSVSCKRGCANPSRGVFLDFLFVWLNLKTFEETVFLRFRPWKRRLNTTSMLRLMMNLVFGKDRSSRWEKLKCVFKAMSNVDKCTGFSVNNPLVILSAYSSSLRWLHFVYFSLILKLTLSSEHHFSALQNIQTRKGVFDPLMPLYFKPRTPPQCFFYLKFLLRGF